MVEKGVVVEARWPERIIPETELERRAGVRSLRNVAIQEMPIRPEHHLFHGPELSAIQDSR
ncbi:hypothetical protein OG372_25425 [Streptomyces sp. NBC_01020]|uniref:hypothetical protein n=1 Tax=unclassified Streptomyces TaxID=2593676 RepID=UPI0038707AE8|nr:hypothetical protein OG372_25425 [Streptomyces sp. NBC_01020]WSX67225.1 hypothetical protein OG221_11700 [Streptomyces sp. NBC_00932]